MINNKNIKAKLVDIYVDFANLNHKLLWINVMNASKT